MSLTKGEGNFERFTIRMNELLEKKSECETTIDISCMIHRSTCKRNEHENK